MNAYDTNQISFSKRPTSLDNLLLLAEISHRRRLEGLSASIIPPLNHYFSPSLFHCINKYKIYSTIISLSHLLLITRTFPHILPHLLIRIRVHSSSFQCRWFLERKGLKLLFLKNLPKELPNHVAHKSRTKYKLANQ